MRGFALPARFATLRRLIAGVAVVACLGRPAVAQNGIPVFENKYDLHYRFPGERSEILPAAFRTTISGVEKVIRDQRQTDMRYDGSLGFTLAGRALSASGNVPEGSVDLYVRLTDVQLDCQAGRGSYSLAASDEGLKADRPMVEPVRLGPHDQYVGSHTVTSLLAKPATIRFCNGALLAAPVEAPMLTALDCAWMYTGMTSMLPPLPTRPIVTGRTWTAGMPVRLSVFGLPQIIRFDCKFEEYNEQTHVAVVSWKSTLSNTSVVPVPGVHHIGLDAVASGTMSGSVRLHVDTGTVLGSEMHIDLNIRHIRSSNTTVLYTSTFTLENLDHPDPEQLNVASAGSDQEASNP